MVQECNTTFWLYSDRNRVGKAGVGAWAFGEGTTILKGIISTAGKGWNAGGGWAGRMGKVLLKILQENTGQGRLLR